MSTDIALMAHLMRRAGFGANREEIERRAAVGYDATVEELLNPETMSPSDRLEFLRYHPHFWKPITSSGMGGAGWAGLLHHRAGWCHGLGWHHLLCLCLHHLLVVCLLVHHLLVRLLLHLRLVLAAVRAACREHLAAATGKQCHCRTEKE